MAFSGAGMLLIKKEPTVLGDGRTATQTPAEDTILIRTLVESGWRPFPGISPSRKKATVREAGADPRRSSSKGRPSFGLPRYARQ